MDSSSATSYVLASIVALLTILPSSYLIIRAFDSGTEQFFALLFRPRTFELLGNTLLLALSVGVCCFILGIATAWFTVRVKLPFRRIWPVLAALPLAIPSYLIAYSFAAIFPQIHGFWPLLLVMVLACYPYVTLPVLAALQLLNQNEYDLARSFGVGTFRTFSRVILPKIIPAALAGTLLSVLYTMADFGSPSIMRFQNLSWSIFAAYEGSLNRTLAAALAILLVALALVVVLAERNIRKKFSRNSVSTKSTNIGALAPTTQSRFKTVITATALTLGPILAGVVPITVMLAKLFEGSRFAPSLTELIEKLLNTATLGIAAAVVTVLLALPISYLAARKKNRFTAVLESTSYLGNAMPGVVIGLAFVFLAVNLIPDFYQTLAILILAYAILFLPKAIGSSRSAIELVPSSLEETARVFGKSSVVTIFTVTLRNAWPGIAYGALLVMLTVMKELPTTLMLRPIGLDTLATELWQHTTIGAYGAAAPAALLLVLVACIPAWLLGQTPKQKNFEQAQTNPKVQK